MMYLGQSGFDVPAEGIRQSAEITVTCGSGNPIASHAAGSVAR